MKRSQQGEQTGKFGLWLSKYLADKPKYHEYQVYYDHGDKQREKNVVATKGFLAKEGEEVTNKNRLADIDVVIGILQMRPC